MNILSISQHIYTVLVQDWTVYELTAGRIFPLASKTESESPFIAFARDDVQVSYTKDGRASVTTDVSVFCVAVTHRDSITLAGAVADALDGSVAEYDTFSVTSAKVTGADEAFIQDSFVQTVRVRFRQVASTPGDFNEDFNNDFLI